MADRIKRIEWAETPGRHGSYAVRHVEAFRGPGEEPEDDTRNTHDVQELTDAEMSVYEAVASLAVNDRVAHLGEVMEMTDRPREDVRRSLTKLVGSGWVVQKADGFVLGPHDWGLEY